MHHKGDIVFTVNEGYITECKVVDFIATSKTTRYQLIRVNEKKSLFRSKIERVLDKLNYILADDEFVFTSVEDCIEFLTKNVK